MRLCLLNGFVLLASLALPGCASPAPDRHVSATIDSDSLAPAISLSRPTKPTRSRQSERPANEQTSYFRGNLNSEPGIAAAFEEACVDDCEPLSAEHDWDDLGPSLVRDLNAMATWETAGILLAGGAASLAVRETVDDDVADWTAESHNRWGDINDALSVVGSPAVHFAAVAALWGTSLELQDPELHSLSGSMMNALVITGASTLALKLIADTEVPNGEGPGWPSGHTSSTVTLAAVLDEYYGPKVGIPAYLVAGAVAWQRIDDREHDLSDVIFGAALGYVVGKVVAHNHLTEQARLPLVPYFNPLDGSPGVGLEIEY